MSTLADMLKALDEAETRRNEIPIALLLTTADALQMRSMCSATITGAANSFSGVHILTPAGLRRSAWLMPDGTSRPF